MLRLPRNRPAIENRGVDSAANTYLTAAIMLAAGLEGVRLGLHPGEPIEELTYDWTGGAVTAMPAAAVRLPRNLPEAVDAVLENPLIEQVFPTRVISAI